MFHCGRRLESLIVDRGFQKKEFAQKIKTPPQTLSGWFRLDDIKLDNIRRCCEVLNIKLWEFFVEDETELKDYVTSWITPGQIEFLKEVNSLNREKREKLLEAFTSIVSTFG